MGFGERLREKRIAAGIKQVDLAKAADITVRTLQYYESEMRKPSNMIIVQKLADSLGTTTHYLLGTADTLVLEAKEKAGSRAARDIEQLVSEVSGLFAGGSLSEESMDGAMKALNEAYWIAKENNRKYGRRKTAKVKVKRVEKSKI